MSTCFLYSYCPWCFFLIYKLLHLFSCDRQFICINYSKQTSVFFNENAKQNNVNMSYDADVSYIFKW